MDAELVASFLGENENEKEARDLSSIFRHYLVTGINLLKPGTPRNLGAEMRFHYSLAATVSSSR